LPDQVADMVETTGEVSMDEKEIEEKIVFIVAEQMGVDKAEINRDTNFVNDLNADSLDTVELVMEFEDEFDTSIPDDAAEKIQTVGQAIDFIKTHLGDASA
jgi:acyl carrier protein